MPQSHDEYTQAIQHTGSPLLIIAGPGSGKTKTMIDKIAYLVNEKGVKPENILALTFSDKAAEELKERLEKLKLDTSDLTVSTFHSFCLQLLEENVLETGVNFSSGIIERANAIAWGISNIDSFGLQHLEIGNNEIGVIESIMDGISAFRDELIGPVELEGYLQKKAKEKVSDEERDTLNKLGDLLKVYKAYEKAKKSWGVIDFDDMVHEAADILKRKPLILKHYRAKYQHILVDEFQDTNYAQLELVKLLGDKNVTAVGDDDQCIYRFRGAYLTNFSDFREHFKGTKEIVFNKNHRSTKNILAVASQIMEGKPNRIHKDLETSNPQGDKVIVTKCENEDSQVAFVIGEIKKLLGKKVYSNVLKKEITITPKDIAILSRKKMSGAGFVEGLKKEGVPCEFVGEVDFLSTAVIRDVIAYLKIANNPMAAGIQINRVLKVSGISEKNVQKINTMGEGARWKDQKGGNDYVFDMLSKAHGFLESQGVQAKEIFDALNNMVEAKEKYTIPQLVYEVMMNWSDIYKRELFSGTIDGAKNVMILNEFLGLAEGFERMRSSPTIADFLEYLEMLGGMSMELKEVEEADAVKVMTIHQSKGKQFPIVFIVDMATNRMPMKYHTKQFFVPNDLSKGMKTKEDEKELSLQEERRLFYVAATRAEAKLFITYARKYGENKNETKPSKFLDELKFDSNPKIEIREHSAPAGASALKEKTNLEKAQTKLQKEASEAIMRMQTKTALQKVLELEKIKHLGKGSLDSFSKDSFLASIDDNHDHLLALVEGRKLMLIDKDKVTFSASRLKTYDSCPLQFKFNYVLKVPGGQKTFFDMGSAVHSVIETLTNMEKEGKKPTKEEALKILEHYWNPGAYKSRKSEQEDRVEAERLIVVYLDWQKANKNKIIGAEIPFKFMMDGHAITGKIDRIEEDKDGNLVVIDYKSGGAWLNSNTIKEDLQVNMYALACQEKFKKIPKEVSLFYLRDNKLVTYNAADERVNMDAQKARIKEIIANILKEEFAPKGGFKECEWCDYGELCEGEK